MTMIKTFLFTTVKTQVTRKKIGKLNTSRILKKFLFLCKKVKYKDKCERDNLQNIRKYLLSKM